jgi:hypothetical protein
MVGMRKSLIVAITVVAMTISAIVTYKHFRLLPISLELRKHSALVTNAKSAGCQVELSLNAEHALILQVSPDISTVKLNEVKISVLQLEPRIEEILRTRLYHIVYMVEPRDADSIVLENILTRVPQLERVCLIDPLHPPGWYPPRREPVWGGGGLVAQVWRTNQDSLHLHPYNQHSRGSSSALFRVAERLPRSDERRDKKST